MTGINGFGAGMSPRMNPDDYARKYAKENRISLEEAKDKLREQHGDPQKPQISNIDINSSIFTTNENSLQGVQNSYIEEGPQKPGDKRDPNREAQKYAQDNNISLEEAQSKLHEQYGDPQKAPSNPLEYFLNLFKGLFDN